MQQLAKNHHMRKDNPLKIYRQDEEDITVSCFPHTSNVEVVITRAAHTFCSDQYEHPQMCGPDLILIEEMHENKTKS